MIYDGTGVDASGGFPIIKKPGWYAFRVGVATESKSKNGDYQVIVDAVCLHPDWKDYTVRDYVTFLPKDNKGAGMALHFLKCIGEPHEGILDINPMSWEGKNFMGKVIVDEYNGRANNKFAEISPIRETSPLE